MGDDLTFRRLRETNARRVERWHGPESEPWSGADWSNAMAEEMGEAANVVKKLRRGETGVVGSNDPSREELLQKLGAELADTIIYADLLAQHYGINLGAAVVWKFDAVSEREGFPERLGMPARAEPNLGCATTRELLTEALARIQTGFWKHNLGVIESPRSIHHLGAEISCTGCGRLISLRGLDFRLRAERRGSCMWVRREGDWFRGCDGKGTTGPLTEARA